MGTDLSGGRVDQEKIWYAVGIMKDALDLSGTSEDNVAYQITSVGSCQGIRKVIRKVYTLGDNGESGGGGSGGEETLDLPGLVQAGGTVTVVSEVNGNMIVNVKESRVAIGKDMANKIMV